MKNDSNFEWDEAKAEANYAKHRVDFFAGAEVFGDPFAIEHPDPWSATHGEERFRITGIGKEFLLTVVFTERGEGIRIISARRATRREHDNYYRQNSQG